MAWTWLETFEAAGEPVMIPAMMGLDRGVWFVVTEGVRGNAVRDGRESRVVYVLVESSTHYLPGDDPQPVDAVSGGELI